MSVLREEKEEIIQKKNNFWLGLKKDNRNKQSSKESLTDTQERYLFAKGEQKQGQKTY